MKKASCFLLVVMLVSLLCLPARAEEEGYVPGFDITAEAVYLFNMETEDLIYAKNKDKPLPPASLTKVLTCILALEHTENLDTEVLTYPTYVQDYLYQYQLTHGGISLAGDLRAGEQLTMRQALYALMLPSANEVAMIIADHIGGSQDGFAQMMNQRAKELGAVNTNFVNPNGLYDEKHLTTAYDMAQITMYALTIPEFVTITSSIEYKSGATNYHENITWKSTNEMMDPESSYYFGGLKGVKTGSVPEAGSCFVSTCTRDGFTYLLVVMGSPYLDEEGNALSKIGSFVDTANIYDWVFKSFRRKTVVDRGEHVASITLRLSSEKDVLKVMAGERFTTRLNVATETTDVVKVTEYDFEENHINAPVKKGDEVGELVLKLGGEEIGRVTLLAAETVDASPHLVLLDRVGAILSSFWFKFIFILVILIIVLYIVLIVLRNRGRRRGGYRPRRRL